MGQKHLEPILLGLDGGGLRELSNVLRSTSAKQLSQETLLLLLLLGRLILLHLLRLKVLSLLGLKVLPDRGILHEGRGRWQLRGRLGSGGRGAHPHPLRFSACSPKPPPRLHGILPHFPAHALRQL